MTLGNNIYELRKKRGISQEQLGEEIDVTRQTISNWELDETTPNPEQLKKLSKALNVSVDDLINNDIKNILEEKISNTEKNTNKISKTMKYIFIGFIIVLLVDIISFIYMFVNEVGPFSKQKEDVPYSYVINEEV